MKRNRLFAVILSVLLVFAFAQTVFAGEVEGGISDEVSDLFLEESLPMELDTIEDEIVTDEQEQLPAESVMGKETAPDVNTAADSNFEIHSNGVITGYTGSGGDVTIPDVIKGIEVTGIGLYVFNGCTSLTSIAMPNSVTSIEEGAFIGCTSLTSITIPSSVTRTGGHLFRDCTSLTSITIPSSMTYIGYYMFGGCTSLTSITIPNSVTSIGQGVFNGCTSLTNITIPSSMTDIGHYAFNACTSLTNITIPSNVTYIGDGAFARCTRLVSITIPDSVTRIGKDVFYNCASNFTIYGATGSYAETYAKDNNIPFKSTGTVTTPAVPQNLKAQSAQYNSIKLTWDKASNATGYYIYSSTSKPGSYTNIKKIASADTTSFANTGLTTGKTYYYKIVAYSTDSSGKVIKSKSSSVVSAKPLVAAVKGLKAKAYNGGKIRLTWTKSSGASGYYVQRATSAMGTYKTVKTLKNVGNYTDASLSAGKSYYYKIVPYRTVSGSNIKGKEPKAVNAKAIS